MATLYVSAISLITLLFQYVNVLFPDRLNYGYDYDPFSGPIRFAMASLIIFFPLYVLFTRLVHQDIRRDPEKGEGGLRKWLIYITLFVAGVTIAGDLVALVNTFLSGELTARFLLKVLIILVVVGGGFLYYWHELKGTWERRERESKMIGGVVSLLVLATLVGGFFVIGSPMKARELRFDAMRVRDLQTLQMQVVNYWQAKEALPPTLEALEDPLLGFAVPVDPETGDPYDYRPVGALTFQLCAIFNLPREAGETAGGPSRSFAPREPFAFGESWEHAAGEACFERTIDPELFPPRQAKPLL